MTRALPIAIVVALVVALLLACKGEPASPGPGPVRVGSGAPSPEAATVPAVPDAAVAAVAPASGANPAGSAELSIDPWATPAPVDPSAGDAEPPGVIAVKALADRACPTVKQPYFYRIEKAGKISHILGTRHLGVPLAKMPPPVHDAIARAKLAVFEVAPGDDTDAELDDGASLAQQLGDQRWSKFQRLVGTQMASSLERAPPLVAMLMLISLYEDRSAALDHEIEQRVIARKIPTRGLETSAFQDALLVELLDLRMLRATIDGTPDRGALERESIEDLAEYCAGTDEVPGMDARTRKLMRDGGYTDAEIDAIDEKLVHARNRDWIPKLAPILDRGGAFIAVGADHLTGPRGVIALLAAKGYQATRVSAN